MDRGADLRASRTARRAIFQRGHCFRRFSLPCSRREYPPGRLCSGHQVHDAIVQRFRCRCLSHRGTSMTMITRELATYASALQFDAIPDEVVAVTKAVVLDCLGTLLAGTQY